MPPAVKLEAVSRVYPSGAAVADVSFALERGRVVGLLGPNGAGKSTIMRMMAGGLTPSSGRILVDDVDVWTTPERGRGHVGYLPERAPLYGDLAVVEYLDFVARLKRIPSAEVRPAIEHLVERLELNDVRRRLIRNLSRGFRQRVALAQAFLGAPPVLLLDEPTTGLDVRQARILRSTIRAFVQDRTVLLASHMLHEISELCDHVLILCQGTLVASGTPEALVAAHGSDSRTSLEDVYLFLTEANA